MKPPASHQRRTLLQASTLVLLLGRAHLVHGASVLAVRLWPAPDYTRVTIESDVALRVGRTQIDATRLVLELDGTDLLPSLRELVGKLRSDDPNIAAIRVAPGGANGVRLSLDLKQAIQPQIFHLQPVAAYQHRLVLDLHPQHQPDPLEQLITQRLTEVDQASERAARLLGLETADDPLGALIAQRATPTPTAPPPKGSPPKKPAPPPATEGLASDSRSDADRLIIVALDPGHGGEDPGAIGPAGTQEKDVVLSVAHKLRERINATRVGPNAMRAYLTRDADFFVPLHVRVQKAQRVRADLFISIHADAFMNPEPAGASVFALSTKGASSATARWMANKENAADLVGGLNVKAKDATVQRTLLDMSTTAQIKDSLKLGSAMLGEVQRVGKLHKPTVEQAGFAVLKAPDIPSVLVETAFISNPQEEERLRSEAYQDRLADALLKGIVKYFSQNPPLARSRPL